MRTKSKPVMPVEPDRDALQRIVTRRLAFRLGVSLSVATVVASLAGLGPDGRAAR